MKRGKCHHCGQASVKLTDEDAALSEKLQAEVERLRTVLRSLISCGGTSPIIRATAMNTLEAGSGDAWLATQQTSESKENER